MQAQLVFHIQSGDIQSINKYFSEYTINETNIESEDNEAAKRRSDVFGKGSFSGGVTLLHWAVEHEQIEIAEVLLLQYASLLNAVDDQGATALHYAALNGCVEFIQFLCLKGAEIRYDENGESPLHCAALNGYTDVAKYLVENTDVDINSQSTNGSTALHLATMNKQLSVLGYLLSLKGINPNLKDANGFTPAIIAGGTNDDMVLSYFEDGKRELLVRIELLEDTVINLQNQLEEANILHESDQRSVAQSYKLLKIKEDEVALCNETIEKHKTSLMQFNSNSDVVKALRNELHEAQRRIVELETNQIVVEAEQGLNRKELISEVENAHTSLSNLISLFNVAGTAITDARTQMEIVKRVFTSTTSMDVEE